MCDTFTHLPTNFTEIQFPCVTLHETRDDELQKQINK